MIYFIELVATSPYALVVALILLGAVVVLQMRRMRSSKRIIVTQARKINNLERQIAALEAQIEAERATAHNESTVASVADKGESANVAGDAGEGANAAGDIGGAVQHVDNQGITICAIAPRSEIAEDADIEADTSESADGQMAGADKLSGSDEDLLNRFIAHIEENMSDINLSIDDISSDMCMSRSNLFRKIKQITGIGPNEYIRLARLKRAAELLHDGRHSIADICMLVGFNSPSYFSSCFKKQYGCLPKDYK